MPRIVVKRLLQFFGCLGAPTDSGIDPGREEKGTGSSEERAGLSPFSGRNARIRCRTRMPDHPQRFTETRDRPVMNTQQISIPRSGRLQFLLAVVCFGTIPGCSSPPEDLPDGRSSNMVILEGLPHPMMEPEKYQAEKSGAKPLVERAGYPFYRESLPVPANELSALSRILSNPATYRSFSGEKKCGGFHPDYAVEWPGDQPGVTTTILLCFGCMEAKLIGPHGKQRFDLDRASRSSLRKLLVSHWQNRPKQE